MHLLQLPHLVVAEVLLVPRDGLRQVGVGGNFLDPFGGSGTTARACKDMGRDFILIEKEPKYCEIAMKRLEQEVLPL